MFNGLGALTQVGTGTAYYVDDSGSTAYIQNVPLYFKIGDIVTITTYTRQKSLVSMLYGKITSVNSTSSLGPRIEYGATGSDGKRYVGYGVQPTWDPSLFNDQNLSSLIPTLFNILPSTYNQDLANQKTWIVALKQIGLTHQSIINIDNKLASGFIATSSEIDSVRTVFVNTSKTAPTQIGMTVVIGVNEQNGLPYPILGVTVGVSPNGNYLAQSGTDYFEFVSGTWQIYSTVANLEAKIADLQAKINNAKAALAAAQQRLSDLIVQARALGISV